MDRKRVGCIESSANSITGHCRSSRTVTNSRSVQLDKPGHVTTFLFFSPSPPSLLDTRKSWILSVFFAAKTAKESNRQRRKKTRYSRSGDGGGPRVIIGFRKCKKKNRGRAGFRCGSGGKGDVCFSSTAVLQISDGFSVCVSN